MIKKKFKFYESKKLYTPETKEELKKLINTSNIDFKQIDTSKITDMSKLFYLFKFNPNEIQKGGLQDISGWDVSNVKDMSKMFIWSNFNGDINNWDVSNVENMQKMFSWSRFNQDINNWNVSNVKNMSWMFYESKFNQDISNWNISNVEDMSFIFYNSKFSYFDNILEKWPKIINSNCKIEKVFSNLEIQKEFENKIKKYQKLKKI